VSFDLNKILLHGFYKKQLSPFYIFKTGAQTSTPRDYLESWLKNLFAEIIKEQKAIDHDYALKIVEQGHADILWQKREDSSKNYSIKDGDLDELFSFMEYGSLELPWRFAVIEDPQKLSITYLNKLLKTLEEPAPNTSVIFLDYENTQFLDTIHSRAVEFTLADKSLSAKWKKIPDILNIENWLAQRLEFYPSILKNDIFHTLLRTFLESGTGIGELMEKIKKMPGVDNELAGLIVEYEADRPGRFKQKSKLCSELKWFQESKTFNNSAWERALGLLMVANS
jgi:hypothetical protein